MNASRKLLTAFTLTEVMVAIALALLIILGVNTVFKAASDTVGTGFAVSEKMRDLRAADTILNNDFSGILSSANTPLNRAPFLIIRGQQIPSFRDRQDFLANGSVIPAPADPEHIRRQDTLSFFSRGDFRRQTGGNTGANGLQETVAPIGSSSELAYIWYGHLWLPNNGDPYVNNNWYYDGTSSATTMTYPGWGNPNGNPNNYFANQWILGRVQILLKQPDINNQILTNNIPYYYYTRPTNAKQPPTDPANQIELTPLAVNSMARYQDGAAPTVAPWTSPTRIQWSRFDMAGCNGATTWDDYANLVALHATSLNTVATNVWADNHFGYRFRANPFIDRPNTGIPVNDAIRMAANLATTTPIFLNGCENIIVEFAGDYMAQNPANGLRTFVTPTDGIIDFNVINGVREIRWYGLPRDIDGTGVPVPLDSPTSRYVRTVYQMRGLTAPNRDRFEQTDASTGLYTCAWSHETNSSGQDVYATFHPRLIRITIQLSDAQGKLANGMSREFIFPIR